jgi:hypothetical protein
LKFVKRVAPRSVKQAFWINDSTPKACQAMQRKSIGLSCCYYSGRLLTDSELILAELVAHLAMPQLELNFQAMLANALLQKMPRYLIKYSACVT